MRNGIQSDSDSDGDDCDCDCDEKMRKATDELGVQ